MILRSLFRSRKRTALADRLYVAAVERARAPALYQAGGVPDTLDGRFDLVVMHVHLICRRLRGEGADGQALAQYLFDTMFDDMDRSLREMGIGDMGVGKRVKQMGRAYFGRAKAYDDGLAADDAALKDALKRNLFGTAAPTDAHLAYMASYVRAVDRHLTDLPAAGLLDGGVSFPPV
ncbi:MAG: ubiquinol-cytochrome C chaperone family protein [Alphaproteobacteria bacterium]